VAAEDTTKQQEYAMNENKNDQVLQVAIPAQNMKRLKRVAEDAFGVDASTLAKIWIIDRLIQLGVCYPYQPVELQDTGSEEASLSGGSLYLKGTLDNGEGRPWPLGVRINKKESGRLPWKQHVVDITLIINNNPHPATLRIYTGHSQFQSEGAYIKQDNRFKKDLVNLGLNRLDHVELEIDGAKKTITVTKKILKQTGTS